MRNNSNAQQTEQNQIHTDFHLKIIPANTYIYTYILFLLYSGSIYSVHVHSMVLFTEYRAYINFILSYVRNIVFSSHFMRLTVISLDLLYSAILFFII